MRSPVISDQYLVENAQARQHHEAGLGAALGPDSDFGEAMEHFEEAEAVLESAEVTVDSQVQLARIWRDKGFTILRRALLLEDADIVPVARKLLTSSAKLTEVAAGQTGELPYDPAGVTSAHGTRKHARREIFAEHGATLGTLARMTTAEEVLLGTVTAGDDEAAVDARLNDQAYYGAAHDFLTIGSNGYYLVSNAMCGARQEVLNGQRLGSKVWLARAARGLAWTSVHDGRNAAQAFGTAARRSLHLRSYDAAKASVIAKP